MRQFSLTIILIMLVVTFGLNAQGSDTFTWIDINANPQILKEITSAFADELQPETVPSFYKYISRIGSFRNTRIVVIGYRVHENDSKEYDHFRAFNYDVSSHRKQEIDSKGVYYRLSFLTPANFEPAETPDVVFKFLDCLECEAFELLSSFRYDKKDNSWKMRVWPDNDQYLMIGSDTQFGDEDHWSYDCLYKVADFNSDKFADIAIRCRETGETTGKVKDELLLYTIQKGTAKRIQIRDKKTFDQISNVLCEGQSSPLCNAK